MRVLNHPDQKGEIMARTAKAAVVPAKKQLPANYDEQLAREAAEIASRIGAPGGDVIQVTQDKMFKFPDGTEDAGPFEAIIVDFVSGNYFYEGRYDPKTITPPACFALGLDPKNLVPSNSSPSKQASDCNACPNNQFGSNGAGKACKNTRVLALLPPDATDDTPLWVLKLSPTALKAFDAYVAKIASSLSAPPIKVISTIGFDPAQDYATIRFGQPKPNPNLGTFFGRREEARKRLLTEPDVSKVDAPKAVKGPGRRK
jgi:hypothetical protein